MSVVVRPDNQEALEALIEDWDNVVIDFSAPSWCVPCQKLEPHFEKAATLLPRVVFVFVDIETIDGNVQEDYGIMSVPTVQFFRNGRLEVDLKGRTVNALVKEVEGLIQ